MQVNTSRMSRVLLDLFPNYKKVSSCFFFLIKKDNLFYLTRQTSSFGSCVGLDLVYYIYKPILTSSGENEYCIFTRNSLKMKLPLE